MFFVFIVNDISSNDKVISAKTISENLLKKQSWVFNEHTPNIKLIKPGDRVVLYLAGKGNMFFKASFKIESDISSRSISLFSSIDGWLDKLFPLSCSISDIKVFTTPIYAKEIKGDLEFIKDKKNWGLFFRQSTKVIGENDFNFLTQLHFDLRG